MGATKIRGETQIITETIKNGQIATDAAIALSKLAEAVLQADGGQVLTADWDIGGSNKITNLPTPTAVSDAVPKTYVDAKISGLSWQEPVIKIIHYVKTDAGAPTGVATAEEYCLNTNEQKIYYYTTSWDAGTATNTGDRYLFAIDGADESGNSGTYTADNKIYEDIGASITDTAPGANWTVLVQDASYQVPTDTQWTYNDDSLEWVQISGAGQIIAGAGLTKSGNTINIGEGDGISVSADAIAANLDAAGAIAIDGVSHGLEVSLVSAGGLQITTNQLRIKQDGTTIALSAAGLKVADAGITETQLHTSVAGDGLTGGGGSVLAVGESDGIDVVADAIKANINTLKGLEFDASTPKKIQINLEADAGIAFDAVNYGLEIKLDGSSLARTSSGLEIADEGVEEVHLDCYDTPNDGDALTWNTTQTQFEWKPFSGTDEKAGVTASDTTPSYLDSKVAEGDGIVTTVLNPSGDEDLEIKANIDTAAGLKFDASTPKKVQAAINTTDGGLVFDTGEIEVNLAAAGGLQIATNQLGINLDGSTLALSASGIEVADAGITETQLHTSVAGAGIAGGGGTALTPDMVSMEVPEGTINGSNVTFTLASTPVSLNARVALFLILNGLVLEEGSGDDYTISGFTITMEVAPKTGSKLIAFYFK